MRDLCLVSPARCIAAAYSVVLCCFLCVFRDSVLPSPRQCCVRPRIVMPTPFVSNVVSQAKQAWGETPTISAQDDDVRMTSAASPAAAVPVMSQTAVSFPAPTESSATHSTPAVAAPALQFALPPAPQPFHGNMVNQVRPAACMPRQRIARKAARRVGFRCVGGLPSFGPFLPQTDRVLLTDDVYNVLRASENEGRVFNPRAKYLKVRICPSGNP